MLPTLTRYRGVRRVGWMLTFALAVYNLVRIRNLTWAPATPMTTRSGRLADPSPSSGGWLHKARGAPTRAAPPRPRPSDHR